MGHFERSESLLHLLLFTEHHTNFASAVVPRCRSTVCTSEARTSLRAQETEGGFQTLKISYKALHSYFT